MCAILSDFQVNVNLKVIAKFAYQVPSTATEVDLQGILQVYGYLQEVHILRDSQGTNMILQLKHSQLQQLRCFPIRCLSFLLNIGRSKGCAFVTYQTAESAQAAIAGVHDKVFLPGDMRGKPLQVRYANPPRARAST